MLVLAGLRPTLPPPKVVAEVELGRYMGKWYAVAHIPSWFERGCQAGTTATYTLLPDGTIEVLNECYDPSGDKKVIRGRAWIPNPQEPGKLKVSFLQVFGHWLFAGNYWILALGPDYSYAVVDEPQRKYGWVLSRTPTLSNAAWEEVKAILKGNGYDWAKFVLIDQSPHIASAR
ncbi:MAG: lipocalin family protein [Candidatus Bipolaricaulaceae bacterium]